MSLKTDIINLKRILSAANTALEYADDAENYKAEVAKRTAKIEKLKQRQENAQISYDSLLKKIESSKEKDKLNRIAFVEETRGIVQAEYEKLAERTASAAKAREKRLLADKTERNKQVSKMKVLTAKVDELQERHDNLVKSIDNIKKKL